jgi:hypothetical protein
MSFDWFHPVASCCIVGCKVPIKLPNRGADKDDSSEDKAAYKEKAALNTCVLCPASEKVKTSDDEVVFITIGGVPKESEGGKKVAKPKQAQACNECLGLLRREAEEEHGTNVRIEAAYAKTFKTAKNSPENKKLDTFLDGVSNFSAPYFNIEGDIEGLSELTADQQLLANAALVGGAKAAQAPEHKSKKQRVE